MSVIEITGGAGPRETAAIMALVARVLEEESRAAANPAIRPRQSQWVLAWRPREIPAPLPSHTYDLVPWAEREPGEDDEAF